MLYDIAIIGGGPAGLSAALTAKQRGKTVILFDHLGHSPKLSKSPLVKNYLGLPDVSGRELVEIFLSHVKQYDVEFVQEKITSIYPDEEGFSLFSGSASYRSLSVVYAAGAAMNDALAGESRLLGRGVSYCGTCDGMLFKGKKVAVIASVEESETEVHFLSEICESVLLIPFYKGKYPEGNNITVIKELPKEILGKEAVTAIRTDKGEHPVDGVFIFHAAVDPENIISGLELEDSFIKADADMKTNIYGFFAAGDCTGQPWQIAKAAGQGQVAALSAVLCVDKKIKRESLLKKD